MAAQPLSGAYSPTATSRAILPASGGASVAGGETASAAGIGAVGPLPMPASARVATSRADQRDRDQAKAGMVDRYPGGFSAIASRMD